VLGAIAVQRSSRHGVGGVLFGFWRATSVGKILGSARGPSLSQCRREHLRLERIAAHLVWPRWKSPEKMAADFRWSACGFGCQTEAAAS
jgi:hypothetical protein